MKLTNFLKLKKPESTDYVQIEDLNENMDLLDGKVKELSETPAPHNHSVNDVTGVLPLSGGTMTGELRVNGGDAVGGSKIVLETSKGQITNSSTQTIFGFTAVSTIAVGHSSYILAMRGSGARPKYNSNDLALKSDIPTLTTETWTFTLEDGSTVTKAVYVG